MSTETKEVKIEETNNDQSFLKWRKAKKVAVMVSFVGKDYLGMQRNPGFKTIEEDLLKAFKEADVISEEWYSNPQKGFFQRASRTDKGVSAARMIISLKMVVDEKRDETISRINSKLPSCIKVQAIKKVTKNFNAKSAADARTYLYFLPTFAFAPIIPINDETGDKTAENTISTENSNGNGTSEKVIEEPDYKVTTSFKMDEDLRKRVNEVLKEFIGSRYYHNYTSGKLPLEPSSQRYITHFECSEPFDKNGLEFAIIKIKGQSFMLHQIRKMIGMAIAVVRGQCSEENLRKTWETLRIDIPRAPGLGLMLDEIHYDRYNTRFAKDGIHEGLLWDDIYDDVEAFKHDLIFQEMIDTEVNENSMLEWLKVLPAHTFAQRHFENTFRVDTEFTAFARPILTGDEKSKTKDDDEIENVTEND